MVASNAAPVFPKETILHNTSRPIVHTSPSRLLRFLSVACCAALCACAGGPSTRAGAAPGLAYTADTNGLAPIPFAERGLPSVVAENYFKVSDGPAALESPAFDRLGNLFFVDVYEGKVFKLTADRQLSTIFADKTLRPAGLAIHRNGRIYLAGLGDFAAGSIVSLDPDGRNVQTVLPASAGYVPDDLVFDKKGGIYFTDFKGTPTKPTGGVYYIPAEGGNPVPVIGNMAIANGVALSPDEKVLWSSEFSGGRLHRVDLNERGLGTLTGASVPYHFTGRSPDSMRTDVDGNVYVCMWSQARILVFNPNGVPIGQITLPGREAGQFLKVTSLGFLPGSSEMVIVARDELAGQGAMIFKSRGFAAGKPLYSHQN